jgi:hypothetical protein
MKVTNDNKLRKLKGGMKNMNTKKIIAIGAVFAIAVLLVSTFALGISAPTITGNAIDIFGKEESVSDADVAASSNIVDDIDVYDIVQEVEIETELINDDPDVFRSRKMVQVQGFAYNDDEKLAALVNGIWLKSTVYTSDDSTIESLTKGRLKISGHNFKVERISGDDDEGVFSLSGDNSEGTLRIELDKIYNEGRVKSWKGTLDAVVDDIIYKGNVLLYTKEMILKPKPKPITPEPIIGSGYEYSGYMQLDDVDFKMQSVGNPKPRNIDFQVWGQNNVEGKFALRLVESSKDDKLRTYNGKILIHEIGDEDDKIEGEVIVTVTREAKSQEWNGRITIDDKVYGEERSGEIQIIENKFQKSYERIPEVDPEFEDYERENKKGKDSSSGKANTLDKEDVAKVNEKGFWKRFREFFRVDK